VVEEFVRLTAARQYGYQPLLDRIASQLDRYVPNVAVSERALQAKGELFGPVHTDLCIAPFEFPIGPFNAYTRPYRRNQFLVLVTSGVLTLLYHATKIMGYSTRITADGFSYLDHARIGVLGWTPPMALATVIGSYLGIRAPLAGGIPILEGADRIRTDHLFESCVTFLVGHEYSHALAGHFFDPETAKDLHTGTREYETSADWLSAKLLLGPWRWGSFEDDDAQTRLQTLLAGPVFFFALERLVTEAERRYGNGDFSQDPLAGIAPPAVRLAMMRSLYETLFGKDALPLTDLYQEWIGRIAEKVLDGIDTIRQNTK
jgi:hypothetical protein